MGIRSLSSAARLLHSPCAGAWVRTRRRPRSLPMGRRSASLGLLGGCARSRGRRSFLAVRHRRVRYGPTTGRASARSSIRRSRSRGADRRPKSPVHWACLFPGCGSTMARSASTRARCGRTTWSARATSGCSAPIHSVFCRRRRNTVAESRSSTTGSQGQGRRTSRASSTTAASTSRARRASPPGSGSLPAERATAADADPGSAGFSWSWYRIFSPEHGWARLEAIPSSYFQSVI